MEQQAICLTFYSKLIKSEEKHYNEHYSDQQLWTSFKTELVKFFKLQISLDSRFTQALKNYFKDIVDTFRGEETLLVKVRWVQKLNQLAYDNKFISYRDYLSLQEQITAINESPSVQWLNKLSYVRNSVDLNEFRSQFLIRFAGLSDDQVESIMEDLESDQNIQQLKAEYCNFFQKFFDKNIDFKAAMFVESEWSRWQNKAKMLTPDIIRGLDSMFKNEAGRSQCQIEFNKVLIQIAQSNLYQNDIQVQQRLGNEVQLIQKALEKFSGMNFIKDKGLVLHLGKFGSLASGFAGLDADLDLTILTNSYVNEGDFLKLLFEFLKKEYQEGDRRSNGRKVIPELIATAKTPLIAITISERGKNPIKIDVIINNILGVINSKFLRVYAGVRWVRNLGILVKLWGKSVDLIGKSYLSSYAMILMLIHFLIRKELVKPIMDARTRSNGSPHFMFKRTKMNDVEQFAVYYTFKTQPSDVTTIERVNYFEILQNFMRYYAYEYWSLKEEERIITVDQSIAREVDKEMAITIKDPFDKPHNPGRLRLETQNFMKMKFKQAHELLCNSRKQNQRIQGEKPKESQDRLKRDMDRIRSLFSLSG